VPRESVGGNRHGRGTALRARGSAPDVALGLADVEVVQGHAGCGGGPDDDLNRLAPQEPLLVADQDPDPFRHRRGPQGRLDEVAHRHDVRGQPGQRDDADIEQLLEVRAMGRHPVSDQHRLALACGDDRDVGSGTPPGSQPRSQRRGLDPRPGA